ncbi:acyl-CoA thioester hydrolase [Scopulibacillus darangshiensis]|uniref:Acyl-CoA thioester hydrolase n=1 Tax=Scopulibacillus darangshiensis TaxID=442528 RepID=A0A4R2PB54_9BACL|nr:thioesterase family protein [Scopulibacillus darangshiensis]TCP32339.1 acyl-CoA thioester hydrolase [Scopulibacillus darangshiensis]
MTYQTKITVRFGETDALGHVNNVSYYIYFEQARVDFMKELGFHIGKKPGDLSFVVVSTSCDYIKQAFFDQNLNVETYVSKIGNKSFVLNHDIFDEQSGDVIAKGKSVTVVFEPKNNRALPIPEQLKGKLTEQIEDPEKIEKKAARGAFGQ